MEPKGNKVRKQLTKKEQDEIVPVTNTGALPLSLGYSIGMRTKKKRNA